MSRLDALTSWSSDWRGLRVGVLGLGVTGFAAADTLAELGCDLLVVTEREDKTRNAILDVLEVPVVIAPRETVPAALVDLDPELLIVSPGYRPDHPLLAWAADRGVPVWGDIELAWRLRDKVRAADWITVTGTNGKTTTTRLTAHLLRRAGMRVADVGNIGTPVLDAIRDPEGFDVLVVELSSFQLHRVPTEGPGALRPLASVCLNVADDHLDWHGSRAAYEAAKARVYANTAVACVYNKADPVTRRFVEEADVQAGCRAIGFDLGTPGPSDLGIVDGLLVDRAFLDERRSHALELATLHDLAARGLASPHLVADVLAAAALARAAGAGVEAVRDALHDVALDPHRTQLVARAGGVSWVDDSKATNAHAADAALSAYRSVVWILGGQVKGVDLGPLIASHAARLRTAIVIGVDRTAILAALRRHASDLRVVEIVAGEDVDVMLEAVRQASGVAEAGDTVLLSPAAASLDQFHDYADRGRRFQAAVLEQLGSAGGGDGEQDPRAAAPD